MTRASPRPTLVRPASALLFALALATGALGADAMGAQETSTTSATVHRVSGEVYDSLAFEPLAGALVAVRPSGVTTTTDSTGRFSVVVDQPATEIIVYHSALDEIGLGALVATQPGNTGNWTNAQLATPAALTLWPRLCDSQSPRGTRTAVILGTARLPDQETRLVNARVLVQWQPGVPAAADAPLETIETYTDSIGNYVACGVEEFVEPSLLAQSREAQSGVIRLPSSVRSVRRVDLVLAVMGGPPMTREVRGRIVGASAQPVAGMTAQIDGREGEVVTGDDGRFALDSVPYGSRMLSLRAIGFIPVEQAIDVVFGDMPPLDVPVAGTVELEAVTVTERSEIRLNRTEFDDRRRTGIAQFVDSSAFSRVPTIRTAIQTLSNVRVVPGRGTEFGIQGRNGCLAHIYMDGTLTTLEEVNRIPLENIAAVEAYSSVALAPARFIRVMADSCAVVIFWTKWALRP